ncbi:MAG: diguanylate cyclase [Gammaproteobacteria bacterium]
MLDSAFKHLWKIYLFIILISILCASYLAYLNWSNIKSDAQSELTYANNIVTSSMRSVLLKNQAFLKLLGERLVEMDLIHQNAQARKLIDEMLERNPDLAGFGMADVSGNLVLTSFNIDRSSLPNLLKNSNTAQSFKQAIESGTMVMGRTYFMKALNEWVIPLRYRITNDNGDVVGVMTTGLRIDESSSILSGFNLPKDVELVVIRSDFYRQYVDNINIENFSQWYESPLPDKVIRYFENNMLTQTGMSIDEFKKSGELVSLFAQSHTGEKYYSVTGYDPIFEYFILTIIPANNLYNKFIQSIGTSIGLIIIINIILYYFFRSNVALQVTSRKNLEYQANHDLLTDLPNRRSLPKKFVHWKKQYNSFSVLFIDLDNFKSSNDLFGHSIGDKILLKVSEKISSFFQQSLALRQGGDEFIILTSETDTDKLLNLCKHFLIYLAEPININSNEFVIRASIGISKSPENGTTVDELLRKADMAMYKAKKARLNTCIYSDDLEEQQKRLAIIEKELSRAEKNNEFFLVYQPQVNTRTNTFSGVETLIRWKNPSLGEVSPSEFIPIAESTGMIADISRYVYETAVDECHEIHNTIPGFSMGKLRLSVNFSVAQLFDENFSDVLSTIKNKKEFSFY